jgi:hypothetical protein
MRRSFCSILWHGRPGREITRQMRVSPQRRIVSFVVLTIALVQIPQASADARISSNPTGSVFTYQGRLTDSGSPANGTYDLKFSLFDALTDGNPAGSPNAVTLDNPGVPVTSGIFTVQLDFGASGFSGDNRYLEIAVRPHSSDPNTPAYTTLTPRQQLTSSPYAIHSTSAATAENVSGIVAPANGGTGIATLPNDSGQFLRSSAAGTWSISTLAANDIPGLDAAKIASGVLAIARGGTGSATQNFVDLSSDQTIAGNKTFTGRLSGDGSGLTNISGIFHWQTVTGTSQQAQPNNGYVVTDPGLVTVTLPGNPNVGDTVRVSGLGAGGWKLAQNAGQSVITTTLNTIGTQWTPHESARVWNAVASSADGRRLIAAGSTQIFISADGGVSWTPHESSRDWVSVASSADGSKLAAVDIGGFIYTSTDFGVTWTPRNTTRVWEAVTSSADGSKLAATVDNGQIYTSTDSGVTWTPRDSNRAWRGVASSSDGTKLVACNRGGQLYTSTDSGVTWTARDFSRQWVSAASSSDGNKLAAVDSGGLIYTSSDSGVTWTGHFFDRAWVYVASSADGTRLAGTAQGNQIYVSADSGASWTARESNRLWSSIASSADGAELVAVVVNGQIYTNSSTQPTATTTGTAGFLAGAQSTAIELQYLGNGLFIPLSHEGTIIGY